MAKLFLDDVRFPKDCVTYMQRELKAKTLMYAEQDWHIVRSFKEFVAYITRNGLPDFISFDHDLGYLSYIDVDVKNGYTTVEGKEFTGYHCAIWLINYCMDYGVKLPDYAVHSMNTVGKQNIEGLLSNFKKHEQLGTSGS